MSYRVLSHSLAEQAANIADVYSRVEIVPLARAEILREARLGPEGVEGLSAVDIAELIDGFILLRYDWWGTPINPPPSRTLKDALKIAWYQRKTRTKIQGEDLRTLSGRSSPEPVYPYDEARLTFYTLSDKWVLELDMTVVYPGNIAPALGYLTIQQPGVQADVAGCTIAVLQGISPVTIPITLDGAIWPLPGPPQTTLTFTLTTFGLEYPQNSSGVALFESPGSVINNVMDIAVDLRDMVPTVIAAVSPY